MTTEIHSDVEDSPARTAEELAADEATAAAEEEAALEAGFAEASGIAPPEARETSSTETDNDTDTTNADETDGGERAPDTDGGSPDSDEDSTTITVAQAKRLVQEALDERDANIKADLRKLHGKFGELNGRIPSLRDINKLSLEKLAANYPDIAEFLSEDLASAWGTGGGTGAAGEDDTSGDQGTRAHEDTDTNGEDANNGTTRGAQALPEEYVSAILDRIDDKWQDKVRSKDFANWLDSLPPSERAVVEGNEDPLAVADDIRRFDVWKKEQVKKTSRLDRAVPARRGAGHNQQEPHDEEAAMEAGFRAVAGTRL